MSTNNIVKEVVPYITLTGIGADGTRYLQYFCPTTGYTTETDARCILPKCRVKRLTIRVATNTTSNLTLTLMKNGVATSLVLSPGSGTGVFTATADISFEKGDEFDVRMTWTFPGGSPNKVITLTGGSLEYGNY